MNIVQRPWGTYRIIEQGENYKIKEIVVFPHLRTSLQLHRYRSENMIVTQGVLTLIVNTQQLTLNEGEFHHIKAHEVHRLQNDSAKEAVIIEVQFGEILEEEDIIRIEDDFCR